MVCWASWPQKLFHFSIWRVLISLSSYLSINFFSDLLLKKQPHIMHQIMWQDSHCLQCPLYFLYLSKPFWVSMLKLNRGDSNSNPTSDIPCPVFLVWPSKRQKAESRERVIYSRAAFALKYSSFPFKIWL